MVNLTVLSLLATSMVASVLSMDINCGKNHKAYVWNCQTLLDNWNFVDDRVYDPRSFNCLWSGVTRIGSTACKLLENDSCTLVIAYTTANGPPGNGSTNPGYTGRELKQFVQQSIDQCTSNNEVSSSLANGVQRVGGGSLCLCNHGSASSCL